MSPGYPFNSRSKVKGQGHRVTKCKNRCHLKAIKWPAAWVCTLSSGRLRCSLYPTSVASVPITTLLWDGRFMRICFQWSVKSSYKQRFANHCFSRDRVEVVWIREQTSAACLIANNITTVTGTRGTCLTERVDGNVRRSKSAQFETRVINNRQIDRRDEMAWDGCYICCISYLIPPFPIYTLFQSDIVSHIMWWPRD